MKTNQAAPKRLARKLSAMRAVLSKDERDILDEVIKDETIQSEVAAHAMRSSKTAGKARTAARTAKAEVAAHTVKSSKTAGKARTAARTSKAEVAAHAMRSSKTAAKARTSARTSARAADSEA